MLVYGDEKDKNLPRPRPPLAEMKDTLGSVTQL